MNRKQQHTGHVANLMVYVFLTISKYRLAKVAVLTEMCIKKSTGQVRSGVLKAAYNYYIMGEQYVLC